MLKYMLIFRGGAPEIPDLSPAEMEAHLRKWYAWAGELCKSGSAFTRATTRQHRQNDSESATDSHGWPLRGIEGPCNRESRHRRHLDRGGHRAGHGLSRL
jgi:hypothetical protein